MTPSFKHDLRRAQVTVARILRRASRMRDAAAARDRNVVVGPTFGFHVARRAELGEPKKRPDDQAS